MSGVVVELNAFRSKTPANAEQMQAGTAPVVEIPRPKTEVELESCTEYLLEKIGGEEKARQIDVWAFVRSEMSGQAQEEVEKSIVQTQQRVEDEPPIMWHDCDLATFLIARDMRREDSNDYAPASFLVEYIDSGSWNYASHIDKHRVARAIRAQVDYGFAKLAQGHTSQLVTAAEAISIFASYDVGDFYLKEAGMQSAVVNCLLAKSAILLDESTKTGYNQEERAMVLDRIEESLAFCEKVKELGEDIGTA